VIPFKCDLNPTMKIEWWSWTPISTFIPHEHPLVGVEECCDLLCHFFSLRSNWLALSLWKN